jgi:hypothetical protein
MGYHVRQQDFNPSLSGTRVIRESALPTLATYGPSVGISVVSASPPGSIMERRANGTGWPNWPTDAHNSSREIGSSVGQCVPLYMSMVKLNGYLEAVANPTRRMLITASIRALEVVFSSSLPCRGIGTSAYRLGRSLLLGSLVWLARDDGKLADASAGDGLRVSGNVVSRFGFQNYSLWHTGCVRDALPGACHEHEQRPG